MSHAVQVKIAIAIDSKGVWVAHGTSYSPDKEVEDIVKSALEHHPSDFPPLQLHWVTIPFVID